MRGLLFVIAGSARAQEASCDSFCLVQLQNCISACPQNDPECPSLCARENASCDVECAASSFALVVQTDIWDVNFKLDTIEENALFDFRNHEIDQVCTVEYEGDYYVIGGFYDEQRVSKVSGCRFETVARLPIEMFQQRCSVWQGDIWMCGNADDPRACYRYDLESFEQGPGSNLEHRLGGLVTYNETLLRVAGYTNQVESLSSPNGEWEDFGANLLEIINGFTTAVVGDHIYTFGGYAFVQQDYTTKINKYSPDTHSWSTAGFLLNKRFAEQIF